ncbi:hypothetical protein LTR66_017118 [Elasticomyces elasticus]|nr:hypothetical protein LTR66_017118 [Elasticomyces elasticus]
MNLQGYDSKLISLIIGEDKTEIKVHKGVLTRIPFFEKALSNGVFQESLTDTIELPEDDPEAVARVIHFTHSGHVPPLSSVADDDDEQPTMINYLDAYVVADKFMIETITNALADTIYTITQLVTTIPEELVMVTDLYDKTSCAGDDNDKWPRLSEEDHIGVLSELSPVAIKSVLRELARGEDTSLHFDTQVDQARCLLHTHDTTEKCKKADATDA